MRSDNAVRQPFPHAGYGETARRFRLNDWTATALGHPAD